MKVIYSKYLPVKGFRAINLFGVIFARSDEPRLTKQILNHEKIHSRQMTELLVIGFYVWYILEWLIRWIIYKDSMKAYRNICFEREAFDNDTNPHFLEERKWYGFWYYM